MTRQDLQDFRKLIVERTSLKNQIDVLDAQIQHITPPYGVQPRGGKSADAADSILKLIELKRDYKEKNAHITVRQKEIEAVIDKMTNPVERTVLRLRYISNIKWTDIQIAINYEIAQTFRIHTKAIKNFEKI